MSDWRKFIGKKDVVVAPYFRGSRVRLKDREVRLAEPPEDEGWYRFEVEGRNAKVIDHADAELTGLPKVRGVLACGSLFASGAPPEYVKLMSADEPPMFASCTCHRWHDDQLLMGEIDFEGEAEELVRKAFAERAALDWEKGVSATLRSAFAWATVHRVSFEVGTPCTARELWPHAGDIASGGHEAAVALLERLAELRHGRRIVVAGAHIGIRAIVERAHARDDATVHNASERASEALRKAGGRMAYSRRIGNGLQLEVSFNFGGEHFIALVDTITLRVIDAGICLVDHGGDGHRADDDLTLESLPAAIREAMDLGVLVITRR